MTHDEFQERAFLESIACTSDANDNMTTQQLARVVENANCIAAMARQWHEKEFPSEP